MGGRWLSCLEALLDQAGASIQAGHQRTPAPAPAYTGPLQLSLAYLPGP